MLDARAQVRLLLAFDAAQGLLHFPVCHRSDRVCLLRPAPV